MAVKMSHRQDPITSGQTFTDRRMEREVREIIAEGRHVFKGISGRSAPPPSEIRFFDKRIKQNGVYHHGTQAIGINAGLFEQQRARLELTVMHELGHHYTEVSGVARPETHSSTAGMEARADLFAHYACMIDTGSQQGRLELAASIARRRESIGQTIAFYNQMRRAFDRAGSPISRRRKEVLHYHDPEGAFGMRRFEVHELGAIFATLLRLGSGLSNGELVSKAITSSHEAMLRDLLDQVKRDKKQRIGGKLATIAGSLRQ